MGNDFCCFCCLSEEERIDKVLGRFQGHLPSQAANLPPNSVQKIVGRCSVSPRHGSLLSPLKSVPCVWYKVVVEENIGSLTSPTDEQWRKVLEEIRGVDFFVRDDAGGVVYVPGSQCRGAGARESAGLRLSGGAAFGLSGYAATPQLEQLLQRNGQTSRAFFGNRTLRATEATFHVGEAVACVGVLTGAAPQLALQVLTRDAVTEERMQSEGWGSHEKKSWKALTEKWSAVLVSDEPAMLGGLIASHAPVPAYPGTMMGGVPGGAMGGAAPAPGTASLSVTVPMGTMPGQPIVFTTPSGQTMSVACPPGTGPGSQLIVPVPAPPPGAVAVPYQPPPMATAQMTTAQMTRAAVAPMRQKA
jgi:hypothetical protein